MREREREGERWEGDDGINLCAQERNSAVWQMRRVFLMPPPSNYVRGAVPLLVEAKRRERIAGACTVYGNESFPTIPSRDRICRVHSNSRYRGGGGGRGEKRRAPLPLSPAQFQLYAGRAAFTRDHSVGYREYREELPGQSVKARNATISVSELAQRARSS